MIIGIDIIRGGLIDGNQSDSDWVSSNLTIASGRAVAWTLWSDR